MNTLYKAGVEAKAGGGLERAAIYWQQLLERDPNFGNGLVKGQLEELQAYIYPLRIQHLRDQARISSEKGAWRETVGAWQALLGLDPYDGQAQRGVRFALESWAKQAHQEGIWGEELGALETLSGFYEEGTPRINNIKKRMERVEQNQQWAWLYANAQNFVAEGNLAAAKDALMTLWSKARYYGDPANIAPIVDVSVPNPELQARLTRRRIITTGLGLGLGAIGLTEFISWFVTSTIGYIYQGHTDFVNSVAWSPDGRRIASASDDGTVQVWNALNGANPYTYSGHTNSVTSVVWSPDGQRIASASADGTAQVWNALDGTNPYTYSRHTDTVESVAWSPDGRIASASVDKTVQVWNALNGANPFIYNKHTDIVESVAWSPDGQHIASASNDKTVHVWKTP